MPHEERFGSRDLTYSAWHRRESIQRFVGLDAAQTMCMVDLDVPIYLEYDDGTFEPLILIEVAIDCGQDRKSHTVTKRLAMRADLPAFVVLYQKSLEPNPAKISEKDIEGFRVKRIWPGREREWKRMLPEPYAQWLWDLRRRLSAKVIQQTMPPFIRAPRWKAYEDSAEDRA